MSDQAAERVRILALDYALRVAIAERDQQTVESVLRNHGRRVGAARMRVANLDGTIVADTLEGASPDRAFPYPELFEGGDRGGASAISAERRAVSLDGRGAGAGAGADRLHHRRHPARRCTFGAGPEPVLAAERHRARGRRRMAAGR